jgi:DNA-directed RNA polymerase specialized sigma24 family protein
MESAIHQLDLAQVIRLCREESHQERRDEAGYCFELFRRALTKDDQVAWEAIQNQYHGLVLSWLHRAAGELLVSAEEDDLTQTIFAKFWVSLRRKEGPLIDSFPHIGALLKYLNRCTLTTFLDFQTQQQRRAKLQKRLIREGKVNVYADPIPQVVESLQQQEKLLAVRRWVKSQITDELEMQLYALLYSEGLKPRDVVARYPQQFPTTADVRRVQARMLARARRALATNEPE